MGLEFQQAGVYLQNQKGLVAIFIKFYVINYPPTDQSLLQRIEFQAQGRIEKKSELFENTHNGPYANRAHLFFQKGAGDLIFTTCDCYGLNNVVFNFGAHS